MEDLFDGNEEEGVYPIPEKVKNELFEFAKHFFELGLNVQKGEVMTDKQMELICTIAGIPEIGELSDGFHTFNSLYKQRMILFAALVKVYKDKAWKS